MASLILIILFIIAAFIESMSYAIYELKINKNKPGGISIIILSLVGLVFPIVSYFIFSKF